MNSTELLCNLRAVAAEAAAIVLEVYEAPFDVEYKRPSDPVTAADKRSNAHICSRLRDLYPDIPIVAEESDPSTFADYRDAHQVFFVDPLDGTREFVARNGEFVVMIGLLDGDRPLAGVLHAPTTGAVWSGYVGEGATLTRADGSETVLEVSAGAALDAARLLSTRSHRSEHLERALAKLQAGQVDALGSAGLKCAAVAEGSAEAYVSPGRAGSRWDLCAGEAIVVAAGGRVTDAHGSPIDYRAESLVNTTGIVASNGHVHDAIVECWRDV
ncbi:MAG: 3'(2'),5'-bisphosphate nucleotidase CysQ [Polyangiaceae bacterium]